MSNPNMLDQSYGYADPATVARNGVRLVMMYLSHTPAKNATPAKIKAYHAVGVGVLLGWETTADRALSGYAAGKSDGAEAAAQIAALVKGVGRAPANKLTVFFAVDFDTNAGQHPAIDAYFRGARDGLAGHELVGVYGEADIIDHLHAASLSDGEWQTYAWSGGRLSPQADAYQYDNGEHMGGAEVDFNRIIRADQLGAWWPADHPLNSEGGDPLADLTDAQLKQIADAVWQYRYKRDDGVTRSMAAFASLATLYSYEAVAGISKTRDDLAGRVDAVAKVLTSTGTGVLARVASLQAAVAALKPGTSTGTPVDPAKIADAVVAKVKALVWKVG